MSVVEEIRHAIRSSFHGKVEDCVEKKIFFFLMQLRDHMIILNVPKITV